MDDKKDFKHLLEKNNDSHIIIIDKYIDCESANNYDDDFYIICFEYSLIIIQSKIISYFLPFFNKNKDSTTYCYNEEIKDELQQITNDNIFQFSTSKFFDKISNFLCKFGIYEKSNKVKNFWMTIRRSVVGFLLMKSYNNSKIKRSNSIQFEELFHKKSESFQFHKKDYIELMNLGNGGSSCVYLIYHIELSKINALKIFCNSRKEKDNVKLFERELFNYKNLNHPYFPQFYGILKEKKDKGLIVEYIEGETLGKIKEINIFTSVQMIIKILKIIEYIHNNNFIYRDLKTNNFIVNNDGEIFLIDFDRMIYSTSASKTNEITQDLLNTPPEITFSYSSDIYFIGKNLLKHLFPDEFYSKYLKLKKYQEIINKCIDENPETRPSISELISYYILINGDLYNFGLGVKQDYNKARECYELSAKQNNSDALNSLGILYQNGYGVEQDYKKAREYYELSIKQNNSDALSNLGYLYRKGYGVEQDYKKAKEYYELSIMQNNSDALSNLGDLYYYGNGVEQDYIKAREYYELSAKQEIADAFNNLGHLYRHGYGVEQDYIKAREYFKLSAKQDNAYAAYNLGCFYRNGYGVKQDYKKAKEYFELSAKQNDSDALNQLGNFYFNGYGVEKNYKKAREYYELSAKQDNSIALFNLGNINHNGYGVEKDYTKAREYYELSAKQNDSDALNYLGILYLNGYGVKRDYKKAKEYFELSIKEGNINALVNMGDFYKNDKDYFLAKQYYELAAQENDTGAIYKIGNLFLKGLGVKKNYLKTKEYYEQSANMSNLNALYRLGNLYYNGQGVEQNYTKAKEYYELSGRQGNWKTLFKVGKLYFEGKGVEQNYNKSKEYFELSSYNSNQWNLLSWPFLFKRRYF